MQRDHLEFLKNWRKDPISVPLLIRGARQVGKSWLVNLFGKEFPSYNEVNYYQHNESPKSNAEVDFITIYNKMIVPVEAKFKIKGGMKSLNVFLSKHPKSLYGIKISEGMFSKHDHLREIPLYGVSTMKLQLDQTSSVFEETSQTKTVQQLGDIRIGELKIVTPCTFYAGSIVRI